MESDDYIDRILTDVGLEPGRLIRLKSDKYFWQGHGKITPDQYLAELESSKEKSWITGEDIFTVSGGTLLLYLGRQEKKVVVSEDKIKTIVFDRKVFSFLCGEKIIWWDFDSQVVDSDFKIINSGIEELSKKFELL